MNAEERIINQLANLTQPHLQRAYVLENELWGDYDARTERANKAAFERLVKSGTLVAVAEMPGWFRRVRFA